MSKRRLWLVTSLLACAVLPQSLISIHAEQSNAESRIKPRDLLHITVEGMCIYKGTFEVEDRGMIRMPLVKEVQAAGRTAVELEKEIATKLDKYLKTPKVHVRLIKTAHLTTAADATYRAQSYPVLPMLGPWECARL